MKKLLIILCVALLAFACKKEGEPEPEKTNITSENIKGTWICEGFKANLTGGGDYTKQVNDNLNGYRPNVKITFMANNKCKFTVGDKQQVKEYVCTVESGKAKIDNTNSTGYISNNKVYFTFDRNSFSKFTLLLEPDYPFADGMLSSTTGGNVVMVLKK